MVPAVPSVVIVLAAGEGTRMKSAKAKVLHPVLGTPLVGHVLRETAGLDPAETVVVVGHQRERVAEYLHTAAPTVRTAVQEAQLGTGHAVRCALDALAQDGVALAAGPILVTAGDIPLLRTETLAALLAEHRATDAKVTVLSAELADPAGYGRILRANDGSVLGIVEHKDATADQLEIREINSAVYAFDAPTLTAALKRLDTHNSQGEEYLTDVLGIVHDDGQRVSAWVAQDPQDVLGINDRVQLAEAATVMRDRTNEALMRSGVTIVDPATTWIAPEATIGRDAVVERNTWIGPGSAVGDGAHIGPDTTLLATRVGPGAQVVRSHCDQAQVGAGASVGPFTYLRPGAALGLDSKAGAYVEIKNSSVGDAAKVPHLSYVGDADIGAGTNIGAAVVFVNYDGENKHRTSVGADARVGSDSMLVAPVTIGDGAYTGAGSVITEDVPPGALGLGRARQRNIEGWVERDRPGSASAAAAAAAAAAEAGSAKGREDSPN